ncbi:MAG: tetratricopeptide repeat protein [bacterium]
MVQNTGSIDQNANSAFRIRLIGLCNIFLEAGLYVVMALSVIASFNISWKYIVMVITYGGLSILFGRITRGRSHQRSIFILIPVAYISFLFYKGGNILPWVYGVLIVLLFILLIKLSLTKWESFFKALRQYEHNKFEFFVVLGGIGFIALFSIGLQLYARIPFLSKLILSLSGFVVLYLIAMNVVVGEKRERYFIVALASICAIFGIVGTVRFSRMIYYYKVANDRYSSGQLRESDSNYMKVVNLSKEFDSRYFLVRAYSRIGLINMQMANWERAIGEFKNVLFYSMDDANRRNAYFDIGYAYAKLGDWEKAAENISRSKRGLSIDLPSIEDHKAKLAIFATYSAWETVIELAKKGLLSNGNDIDLLYYLGLGYMEKGRYDEALAQFDKVIRVNPDFISAYYCKGQIYKQMGEYNRAKEQFEVVGREPFSVSALYELRGIYQKLNDRLKEEKLNEKLKNWLEQPRWDFNIWNNSEGWFAWNQLSSFVIKDGVLKTRSLGEDPYMAVNIDDFKGFIDADKVKSALVRMKISDGYNAQVYWAHKDGEFSESKAKYFDIIGDGKWHEYEVNLSDIPTWNGKVYWFRLDPTNAPGNVEIDYIQIK